MEQESKMPVRRRRKSKMQHFKEGTLPYLILLTAAIIVVVFIIGALVRG